MPSFPLFLCSRWFFPRAESPSFLLSAHQNAASPSRHSSVLLIPHPLRKCSLTCLCSQSFLLTSNLAPGHHWSIDPSACIIERILWWIDPVATSPWPLCHHARKLKASFPLWGFIFYFLEGKKAPGISTYILLAELGHIVTLNWKQSSMCLALHSL